MLATRWARRGRLPALLAANPAFEGELRMRLLIAAAVPWMQRLPAELPPFERPAMLLRIAENADFDPRWRALCPDIDIVTIEGEHNSLLQREQLADIARRVTVALMRQGVFETSD
jgi:thioesterase domain-containing protein